MHGLKRQRASRESTIKLENAYSLRQEPRQTNWEERVDTDLEASLKRGKGGKRLRENKKEEASRYGKGGNMVRRRRRSH